MQPAMVVHGTWDVLGQDPWVTSTLWHSYRRQLLGNSPLTTMPIKHLYLVSLSCIAGANPEVSGQESLASDITGPSYPQVLLPTSFWF